MPTDPDLDDPYSQSYDEARERFAAASRAVNARIASYPITAAADLLIDVAIFGAADAPTLVISSGLHGIEGFFGSAVQLALLQRLARAQTPPRLRYVLIHALNPYGFRELRRVNEDNIDLNRNFLAEAADYHGAPRGYAELNAFLNPPSRPTRLEPFRLRAAWHIWRRGLQTLKNAVAGGQYDYPRGLFYGGKSASASAEIVKQYCDAWLDNAQQVLHIDLHTGLGEYAMPTLLLNETTTSPYYGWYTHAFGADQVEPLTRAHGTAYKASGVFGHWMQQHFGSLTYRYVGAEFGTYPIVRVLAALRAENRAHHYCEPNDPALTRSKLALLECFCPSAPAWRRDALESALHIIDRGSTALLAPSAAPE